MSAYSLDFTLREILSVINPSREDWEIRGHIIGEFQAAVDSVESLRGATVEPFGSFVSNLFTRWGDVDISIELPNGSYIASAGKKRKLALLQDVQKALRRKGGFRNLKFIPNARVPILKFESNSHISCDVSINNLVGLLKSKFLYWINEIDGRFRDLVLLVKEWAKAHNINNSKSGSLNSYSLCLLVIFHFQTCEPAILPPLKDLYAGNLVDDLSGVRAVVEERIQETWRTNAARFISGRSRRINRSSLSELFVSFFAKFSGMSSRAVEQGLSPYTGQWDDIAANMRWLPKTYALLIEDPFTQPENAARAVGTRQLGKISEAFETTHRVLVTANQNNQGLTICNLVASQIAPSVRTTAPVMFPGGYYGGSSHHHMAPPPIHRPVYPPPPPQTQHRQAHNPRREPRPNNAANAQRQAWQRQAQAQAQMQTQTRVFQNQGPVRVPQNQAQQVWRLRTDG